jgi:hypothetical protein
MREFYTSINYLKSILDADINVHTITHGLRSMTDIEKKNIFPLAHIQVIGSNVDTSNITFNFEIAVVDLRMTVKEPVTDKFRSNDNELDNLNTTHAVLNRLVTTLRNTQNNFNIDLNNTPLLQPIIFEDSNLLDGWRTEIELIMPNTEISVC